MKPPLKLFSSYLSLTPNTRCLKCGLFREPANGIFHKHMAARIVIKNTKKNTEFKRA